MYIPNKNTQTQNNKFHTGVLLPKNKRREREKKEAKTQKNINSPSGLYRKNPNGFQFIRDDVVVPIFSFRTSVLEQTKQILCENISSYKSTKKLYSSKAT